MRLEQSLCKLGLRPRSIPSYVTQIKIVLANVFPTKVAEHKRAGLNSFPRGGWDVRLELVR
jgi:hypothetical protein